MSPGATAALAAAILLRVLMIDQIQDKDVSPQYRFGWIVSLPSTRLLSEEESDDQWAETNLQTRGTMLSAEGSRGRWLERERRECAGYRADKQNLSRYLED
jgi:hypothetical protein